MHWHHLLHSERQKGIESGGDELFTMGPQRRWRLRTMQGLRLVIPDWSESEGQLGDLIWLKEGKEMKSEVTVRKMVPAIDSTCYHVRWREDRWESIFTAYRE